MPRSTDINTYDIVSRKMLTHAFLTSLPIAIHFTSMREAKAKRLYIYAMCKAAKMTGTPSEQACAYNIGVRAPVPTDPTQPLGACTLTIYNAANVIADDPLNAAILQRVPEAAALAGMAPTSEASIHNSPRFASIHNSPASIHNISGEMPTSSLPPMYAPGAAAALPDDVNPAAVENLLAQCGLSTDGAAS